MDQLPRLDQSLLTGLDRAAHAAKAPSPLTIDDFRNIADLAEELARAARGWIALYERGDMVAG